MDKLKPCPFCGGEAELHAAYDIDTDEIDGYFVICRNKDCTAWPETAEFLTEADAIAAWNTRAERTCKLEPLEAFFVTVNMLDQTKWGVCSNCGTASPIDATYCCECGAKVIGGEE